jgi:hypothetical protein
VAGLRSTDAAGAAPASAAPGADSTAAGPGSVAGTATHAAGGAPGSSAARDGAAGGTRSVSGARTTASPTAQESHRAPGSTGVATTSDAAIPAGPVATGRGGETPPPPARDQGLPFIADGRAAPTITAGSTGAALAGHPELAGAPAAQDALSAARPGGDAGVPDAPRPGDPAGTSSGAAHADPFELPPVLLDGRSDPDPGRDAPRRRSREDTLDEASAAVSSASRLSAGAAEAARSEAPAAPRSVLAQVVERIGLLQRDGRHEISIQLEPAELGAVHVDAVLRGSQVRIQIRAELEHARDLLAQSLPQLRESLAQQGIVASRLTVELGLDVSSRDSSGREFTASRPPLSPDWPAAPPGRAADVARRGPASSGAFDFWV